jgi:hypothetical protein
MTVSSKKEILKVLKQRKFLNKDFDGFKADLVEYGRTHFADHARDLSEPGVIGMLLELAAYVGDVDSFYLDHQFQELDVETAVEVDNIQAHLRSAGVDIVGASPAVVEQTFFIEVPATGNPPAPSNVALPIIHEGTTVAGDDGVQFELVKDLDFNDTDRDGELEADIQIGKTDANNKPTTFILSNPPSQEKGVCISGFRAVETLSVGQFEPFKQFTLSKENVTEIISITDNQGNEYYEVEHLSQDTVFQAILNRGADGELVKDNMVLLPAPFRYTAKTDLNTRLTTLTFGGGSAQSLDDDIIPDPSEFAVPLFGKRQFSRFTLNPGNLLRTTTLGIIAPNSTLTVTYRQGGGLSHNAAPNTIRGASTLLMSFPNDPSPRVAQFVRSSVDAKNSEEASGGEDAPTIDELKQRVPAVKSAQSRIVTKPDLLARIYTMPSNFGRVFRAAVRPDPNNPLASNVFIISRNQDSQLITSPDALKLNLSTYLNQFRMSNDAIDILDAQVINLTIDFSIVVEPGVAKNLVKQNIIKKLKDYFAIKNFEIDQPILLKDVENIIFNNPGVLSVAHLVLKNIVGTVSFGEEGNSKSRVYSSTQFDVEANTDRGILFAPPGGMFEIRFPEFDIKGVTV